ncbi:hypothetical protein AK812_SmicGene29251 [Symbiodinium microadriaticum]|uniref:Uncharacterized protein n=1 Tax=Symbiodinium microadriaticum TaxID=2951 RepID=A0A1Q9D2A7_SYMMI|nr:hypothetical protein AK812_SmicGene29251 [Symbiodinium microadriaticum]
MGAIQLLRCCSSEVPELSAAKTNARSCEHPRARPDDARSEGRSCALVHKRTQPPELRSPGTSETARFPPLPQLSLRSSLISGGSPRRRANSKALRSSDDRRESVPGPLRPQRHLD